MLESIEDFKKVELTVGNVVNGIDSPNLMTADSTAVVTTTPDGVIENKESAESDKEKKVESEQITDEKIDTSTKQEEKTSEEKIDTTNSKDKDGELAKKEESASSHDAAKRISRLTKKWRSTERELSYTKTKLSDLEKENAALKAQVPLEGKPKKEDFEDEEEYQEAFIAWSVANAVKGVKADVATVQEETHERSSLDAVYSTVDDIIERGSEKYSNFEEVVRADDLPLSAEMLEVVLDCETAEDVLYYLGKNPDEAFRINELTTGRMAKEIIKLELKLVSDAEAEVKAKEKAEADKLAVEEAKKRKVTTAPEPITPPKSQGMVEKDPTKMSMAEYRKWREGGGTI